MFKLIEGEQVVMAAGPLSLTTHRVHSEHTSWGSQSVDELFLEHISYQALRMSSRPALLVIAGFSLLLAMYKVAAAATTPLDMSQNLDTYVAAASVFGAFLFVLWYALTRRQVFVVASSAGRIELAAREIPRETLDWLLMKVTEAKHYHRQPSPTPVGTAMPAPTYASPQVAAAPR